MPSHGSNIPAAAHALGAAAWLFVQFIRLGAAQPTVPPCLSLLRARPGVALRKTGFSRITFLRAAGVQQCSCSAAPWEAFHPR